MDSSPVELKPYIKAYEIKQERQDQQMWAMGVYVQNAVAVAIDRCLRGRKSKAEYLKKPILEEAIEKKRQEERMKNLTEEEKIKMTKLLFAQLETMQANFELNHKK